MLESNENTPEWALAYIEDAARITFLDEGSGTKGLRKAVGIIKAALAEAEARGRRQGLEEAAKIAEAIRRSSNQDHIQHCTEVEEAIRSLATTPVETQKPETGESA